MIKIYHSSWSVSTCSWNIEHDLLWPFCQTNSDAGVETYYVYKTHSSVFCDSMSHITEKIEGPLVVQ